MTASSRIGPCSTGRTGRPTWVNALVTAVDGPVAAVDRPLTCTVVARFAEPAIPSARAVELILHRNRP